MILLQCKCGVYLCWGRLLLALVSCIPVSETRLCERGKQCVQDCGTAAFSGLVLIKGVGESLILCAYGEKDDWCKPKSGKLYQKIQLCWGNDYE